MGRPPHLTDEATPSAVQAIAQSKPSYDDHMPSPGLTAHLLSQTTSPPYLAATNHPFLRQAGEGTLPSHTLVHWLYQDRIYAAHAYPRFVGHLIAKVPFETGDLSSFGSSATREETAHRQILECLTFSLVNIVREVKFFEETAAKMEIQADKEVECEREATRNYCAEMARVASLGTLEEGLVFLWAMEKASCITCYKIGRQMYLDSWTFASKQTKKQEFPNGLEEFLKNWTSDEFKKFVDDLEKLVDLMSIEQGSHSWRRAEAVWNRVIELEEAFWPKI